MKKTSLKRLPLALAAFALLAALSTFLACHAGPEDVSGKNVIGPGSDAAAAPQDDRPTFVITENGQPATSVKLTQGGVAWLSVSLSAPPPAPVSASVQLSQVGVLSAIPALMQFDATNYSVPQTLTLFAPQDNTATDKNLVMHMVASGFADGVASVAIKSTNVQSLLVTPDVLTVTEGKSDTFTVRPAYAPTGAMTIDVTNPDPTVATVSPATLSFTAANFRTPQTVTVTGVAKPASAADRSVSLALDGAGLPSTAVGVTVVSTSAQNISVSPSSVTLTEGGGSGTFGVALTVDPAGTVTVNLASSNPAAATVSPSTLTFTSGNFATPQNVTVTPVHDANTLDENLAVTVTSGGIAERDVSVAVKDVDVQAIVPSLAAVSVNQGSTGTFAAKLAFDPVTPLTVSLLSSNTSALTVSPATLTFTSANYSTPQTVTLSAIVGNNTVDQTVSVPLTAPGVAPSSVTVTCVNTNVQKIVVSPTSASVLDTGSATLTAQLAYAPPANTTVTVTSADTTALTVSPATLTFTPTNYNVAQSVTLTGVRGGTGDRTTSVSFASTGLSTVTAPVTVINSASVSFAVTPTTITTTETSAPSTFTVALTKAPAAGVSATLTSSNAAAATVAPATLTFTAANWATPQAVTVTPVHDNNAAPDTSTISVAAAGITTQNVAVTVSDVDVQAIQPSTSAVTLAAGSSTTFTVRLAFAPTGAAAVSLTSGNTAAVTVSPASLSFTSATYATPQTVTVTAPASTTAATVPITLSSPGVANATVTATTTVTAPTCDPPGTLPTPSSGFHNAGQSCMLSGCHTKAQKSFGPFTVAGTIYGAATGGAAVSQANIHLVDGNGKDIKLVSATNGNFFTDQAVAFPITVRASKCPAADQKMVSAVTSTGGSCNGCHSNGSNQGRIHLP